MYSIPVYSTLFPLPFSCYLLPLPPPFPQRIHNAKVYDGSSCTYSSIGEPKVIFRGWPGRKGSIQLKNDPDSIDTVQSHSREDRRSSQGKEEASLSISRAGREAGSRELAIIQPRLGCAVVFVPIAWPINVAVLPHQAYANHASVRRDGFRPSIRGPANGRVNASITRIHRPATVHRSYPCIQLNIPFAVHTVHRP